MTQIIDPRTNQPFDSNELQKPVNLERLTGVRPLSIKSEAEFLAPDRIARLVRQANSGDAFALLTIAEEMEEREPHYRSVLSTRKIAVSQLPLRVEEASDSSAHEAHKSAIQWLIKQRCVCRMLTHALDGLGKGYAVVIADWNLNGTLPNKPGIAWVPQHFEWADPRHFGINPNNKRIEIRKKNSQTKKITYKPLHYGRYIVHTPELKSGSPLRGGLARVALASYMAKSYTIRDWLAFAELYGIPMRIGRYNGTAESIDQNDLNALLSALSGLGTEAAGAVPKSMEIEIEQGVTASGVALFKELASYLDEQVSKAVLGQTMTTDNGSSQSQATVHNEVRQDLRDSDAMQLADTLNDQLVRPFIDYNFGTQTEYPRIEFDTAEPEDAVNFSQAATPLIQAGAKVKQNEVRNRLGLSDLEGEEGNSYIAPSESSAAASTPATDRQLNAEQKRINVGTIGHVEPSKLNPLALALAIALEKQAHPLQELNASAPAPRKEEVDLLAEQGYKDWQAQLAPIVEPITNAINDIASQTGTDQEKQQALLDALPEILDQIDETELVQSLAIQMLKAHALGDHSDT
jgi:phage gp29-like protein